MSRIALVTGSSGFVGRHMVRGLEDRGWHVVQVDIKNGADCRTLFRLDDRRTWDLVVHCAAVVGGRTMIDGAPLQLAAEDLSIDAELFRWAMRVRPARMVLFSSSAAYPIALQQVQLSHLRLHEALIDLSGDDAWPWTPDATYGWVKLTLERLALEANALGIRTHVFRPFSGYGADQDDTYPFPAIVKRAIAHESGPFHVWGHPKSTRDWVHISDVVNCVMAHVEADAIGPVNICTGVSTSFESLAQMALAAFGKDARVVGDTSKPMGVFSRVGDPAQMNHVYTAHMTLADVLHAIAKDLTLS